MDAVDQLRRPRVSTTPAGRLLVPSPTRDVEIHRRLLAGDPVAPADLATTYLDPLLRRLRSWFPGVRDETLVHDAAVDALLGYAEQPSRYDPARASLLAYLTMSAAGDLRNLLKREARRVLREVPLAVEERRGDEDEGEWFPREVPVTDAEEQRVLDALAEQELWQQVAEAIPDPRDHALLRLLIEGERGTMAYAKVLGIADRDPAEQRRIVKRHKDRLKKRLARLGQRFRAADPIEPAVLLRARERAGRRPFFIASVLVAYRAARGISDEDLAALLGCSPETLPLLALCRRPDPAAPTFTAEIEAIAAYAAVDGVRLAQLLREAASSALLASPVPDDVRGNGGV